MKETFGAHLTSDGSLRFFALVTLLNLPPEMLPDVLLLDEPELGLHPAEVALIGDMIKSLATERQIIVATQSPLLVDAFDLDEILVLDLEVDRRDFAGSTPASIGGGSARASRPASSGKKISSEAARDSPRHISGRKDRGGVRQGRAGGVPAAKGVEPQPVLIGTGGNVTVERLTSDMATLYWSFDAVTSLVDFYGFVTRPTGASSAWSEICSRRSAPDPAPGMDETKVFPTFSGTSSRGCCSPT